MIDYKVYADAHSSTPMDMRVVREMYDFMRNYNYCGNPSSIVTSHGMTAASILDKCRKVVQRFINAESSDNIIFTSGATESNNLAINSTAAKHYYIVTSPLEHTSVTEAVKRFFSYAECPLYYHIPLKEDMTLDFDNFLEFLNKPKQEIALVSCIWANNEIGTILPIRDIGTFCKTRNIPFHVDATQAASWIDIDVQANNIDFLSLSAHKVYGPKGVGALYVSDRVKVKPLIVGGGQEYSRRSGTQNMPGIVGMMKALDIIRPGDKEAEWKRIALIRDKMEKFFRENFRNVDFRINGGKNRLPNNLSVTFYGLKSGLLELVNQKISVSDGSACHSGRAEVSPILREIGHTEDSQTIRIGLSKFTTEEEGEFIQEAILWAVTVIRS